MRTDHLDDGEIVELLHGEMALHAAASSRGHVSACAPCAERLARAEREERSITSLLGAVDGPAPAITARHIMERAGAPSRVPDSGSSDSRRSDSRTVDSTRMNGWDAESLGARFTARRGARVPWQRWAAGLVASVGLAGAAWAIPGSPVRGWVAAAARALMPNEQIPPALPAPRGEPRPEAPAPAPPMAGISLIPDGDFTIAFSSAQATGELRIVVRDTPTLRVAAPSGAARFVSGDRRLVVDNAGSTASFDISVPRSARRVVIEVAGTTRFVKQGNSTRPDAGLDSSGVLHLPFVPTPRR